MFDDGIAGQKLSAEKKKITCTVARRGRGLSVEVHFPVMKRNLGKSGWREVF